MWCFTGFRPFVSNLISSVFSDGFYNYVFSGGFLFRNITSHLFLFLVSGMFT